MEDHTARRFARNDALNREAHRTELHKARLELLRLAAQLEHLRELIPLWPVVVTVVATLERAEAET